LKLNKEAIAMVEAADAAKESAITMAEAADAAKETADKDDAAPSTLTKRTISRTPSAPRKKSKKERDEEEKDETSYKPTSPDFVHPDTPSSPISFPSMKVAAAAVTQLIAEKDEEEKDKEAAPFTPIKRSLSRMPSAPRKKLKGKRDDYASAD
jgi:hypothetical protein